MHRLLQALHAQLSAQEQCRQERMALMKETRLDPAKHQRATIDCRDNSLLRLHSVLAYKPEDEKKLFQKLSNLVDGANKLYLKLSSSQSASKNLYSRHEQIRRLKLLLNKCDGAMYWQSTRTTAHPQLTPYPIKKAHRKLGNLLDQLGIILKDIIGGADQKKQILKCCPDKRAERGLYEFFLLSPDRLHILFDKLGERLQAKRTR
ncbi:uncharacterized protein LOC135471540 isoform X2 [Liolophura sinensis]|uniref:uncharacterized protein LOC135471540 isoform X2 n=1 Tax=Liolophura sinensis TaxID=3198878 RepID=UPI003159761D